MATYPLTLGTLLIMLLIAAAALAWGMRTKTPFAWMSHRATIAFLPLSAMVVPVAVVERPRPSYFFYVSVIVIVATMGAISSILRRWPRIYRSLDIGALAVASALILFMPRYSLPPYLPGGRPILQKLEHLVPQRAILLKASGRIVLGDWAYELANYLDLNLPSGPPIDGPQVVFGNDLLRGWEGTIPLEQFLAEQRVHVLYLDPGELAWLRAQPQAKNVLESPRAAGWLRCGV